MNLQCKFSDHTAELLGAQKQRTVPENNAQDEIGRCGWKARRCSQTLVCPLTEINGYVDDVRLI